MPKAQRFDVYREFAEDYVAPKAAVFVTLKPAHYLAITGRGEPGDATFQANVGALYNVAFTVKMARKFAGRDYTVSKLEGIWSDVGGEKMFLGEPRKVWNWKLLIRVPPFITQKETAAAIEKLRAKGKPAEVAQVKLETIAEGQCVQMLHVGPYTAEGPTLAAMRGFAMAQGLDFHGPHHEIYLSDPRRVPAERLKTILRYPVE